jgi:hypothetical protein
VHEVHWRPGEVEIQGVRARQAIVTLPLGVLQSGSVRFLPEIPKQAALD